MAVGGGVSRRGPDLHRDWFAADPLRREAREQVRLARRRAEPEDRRAAGGRELFVELELAARHVEEPAEVDVVGARGESAAHHVEVEAVVDAVHDHARALQPALQRVRVGDVDVLVALEAVVEPAERRSPLLEEPGHGAADRAGGAEDGDHCVAVPRRASSASCALSASHSSMRCSGSSGWRPVTSRRRSMR